MPNMYICIKIVKIIEIVTIVIKVKIVNVA
jgi:hypothetical protein